MSSTSTYSGIDLMIPIVPPTTPRTTIANPQTISPVQIAISRYGATAFQNMPDDSSLFVAQLVHALLKFVLRTLGIDRRRVEALVPKNLR